MPLVYLPDAEAFFLWNEFELLLQVPELDRCAEPFTASLVTPGKQGPIDGFRLPILQTLARLTIVPAAQIETLPNSVATWALASKLAIELVFRERMVPTLRHHHEYLEARWAAALSSQDAQKVTALARSMPPSAHAVPVPGGNLGEVWAPDALLRAYLNAAVDTLARADSIPAISTSKSKAKTHKTYSPAYLPWEQRWRVALEGPQCRFEAEGFAERSVVEELDRWIAPAIDARNRLRMCFRLELPEEGQTSFLLHFVLQSPDDLSLLVPASEVWERKGRNLEKLGQSFRDPQESLIEALGRAARIFPPVERALALAMPEAMELDTATAWTFLDEGAATLADAGFGVIVPSELTKAGQRRLRLRMRVGGKSKAVRSGKAASNFGLGDVLDVDWEAVFGEDVLTARELSTLARQKAPLVRFRGAWVAVDPEELAEITMRMTEEPSRISTREAIQTALAGEIRHGKRSIAVVASGNFAEMLDRLKKSASSNQTPPTTLNATLRPYQERGLAWLGTMGTLGLGACLADDMGLGKTMQLLAFLLRRIEEDPRDGRPALIIAPTSVVGNWEREVERFAPSLKITQHYGPGRIRHKKDFPQAPGSVVLTTYALLRRDVNLLAGVNWSVVALDEAQNIKNPTSATARSARILRASHRFALTGTPVENRLAELWSILEFANPGMLGTIEAFRKEFAMPIERYGNDDIADRLRRIVGPFILRRLKSDPTIIQDLPDKNEMKVICTLTREQATLYKSVVDEEMRCIEKSDGIARRGRVLALLTFLKQICNHPAQYLGESGPIPKRSGKLARLTEMLEEAMETGDKALIFTQYREMGDRLVPHLRASLGCEVVYLHGGTPKKARDEMVLRFQEDPKGPRIFVLSVKAGGTGLNLTAANHVFHYDRWWNPAVEDQATDRAYRIGQTRAVQVHKLVCAGTIEEKVDRLLDQKRELAAKVVGAGEKWITEMGNNELRDLFALSSDVVIGGEEGDEESASDLPEAPKKRVRRTSGKEVRS